MFDTLDLNCFNCFDVKLIDNCLFVKCGTSEVLTLACTLASLGINCEIILIDFLRWKLQHVSPWEVDNS
jgi:hypothetical protein